MQGKTDDLRFESIGQIKLKKYGLTRVLESWIDIKASVSEAWNVLVDFESWKNWNSFIPSVEGAIKVGSAISIKVIAPGLKEMVFNPRIFEIEPNKKIVWGGGFLGCIYKGVHEFSLEYIDANTTRFRQTEKFQGPLVLLMKKMIYKTASGYVKMNEEFKYIIENAL
jgi:hypothetical protein